MTNVEGIADFNAALIALTKDLRKRVVRSALSAAAKPIAQAARSIAKVLKKPHPYRTAGLIKKRIVVSTSRIHNGRAGVLGIYIEPKAIKGATLGKRSRLDPFYYKFVAGGFTTGIGHRLMKIKGGRRRRESSRKNLISAGRARFIPGDDFLGKAFRIGQSAALAIFQRKLKERIDVANKRK